MAKQINSNGHNKPDSFYSTPDTFVTSKGVEVRFIGLNQQRLESLRNAGTMPEVPTREIKNDLGMASQREKLSENDLMNDEEKALWAEYVEKRTAVERRRDENVMKYTFTAGFEVLGLNDEKLDDSTPAERAISPNERG